MIKTYYVCGNVLFSNQIQVSYGMLPGVDEEHVGNKNTHGYFL